MTTLNLVEVLDHLANRLLGVARRLGEIGHARARGVDVREDAAVARPDVAEPPLGQAAVELRLDRVARHLQQLDQGDPALAV